MLSVDEIHVRYGRVPAVSGLSLSVGEGEAVALIGHNGAGKTTTLLTIAGVLKPTRGTIELDGDPITGMNAESVARRGLALVPEGRRVFAGMTVAENLQIGACALGREGSSSARESTDEMVARFPVLGEYIHSAAGNLSGGEQQQLAIARALMSKPRILLLDEPSLGLSPVMADRVYDDLARLREQGITMLVVEQNASRLAALVDRACVIRSGGQLVGEATAERLESEDVKAHLGFHPGARSPAR